MLLSQQTVKKNNKNTEPNPEEYSKQKVPNEMAKSKAQTHQINR